MFVGELQHSGLEFADPARVKPFDTRVRNRRWPGSSMARNDMVRCASGVREMGSSATPSLLDNAVLLRNPWCHIGMAGQRPEVLLLVAIERSLVAQPLVIRVRILVEGVVVGIEDQFDGPFSGRRGVSSPSGSDRRRRPSGRRLGGRSAPSTGVHERAEERHLQRPDDLRVGVRTQCRLDPLDGSPAPMRSRTGHAASLLSTAVVHAAATSGSSAITRARSAQHACCTRVELAVVDVGEERAWRIRSRYTSAIRWFFDEK